ncbi:binding-protein-dependent transport systems inner membrane component [Alicyclobacillus hesperidum URH17-3-68]|uniref:carbohydrate ABC transporter permease n=1 Tax=Alicyclobacillus hesperidum TaxID=89784 RepID=UPI000281AD51|nr:sugar ABC transporter permease [Alicyclobacillus hesperidum]EJY56742.1 binding-protein-dependent transport systems inner membrane component [Alicyclobacillus hesperidum URH17-3-68]GLG01901.1 sugar ABC transporter permease [Alicyclobacillus hesperidum subsp. aegles]
MPSKKVFAYLLLIPSIVYLIAVFGYPIVYNLLISFTNYSVYSIPGSGTSFVGFSNYASVFRNPIFGTVLINTVIFVVGSVFAQLVIGTLLAILFNKKFPMSGILRSLIIIPWLIPLLVSGTAFKWMMDQENGVINWLLLWLHVIHHPLGWLVNPHLALISVTIANIWIGIPFNMVLIYSGLQEIPQEILEAAHIDGANAWKRFWRVSLPSIKSVISITVLLGLIYTLKVFDIIMALTGGGPANASQIFATWAYQLSFQQFLFSQGAAVSNVMAGISIVLMILYLRVSRED